MDKYVLIYKPVGKTPLQMVRELKGKEPKYRDQKIGYAGRLDPMAEGILLLLVGEETKNRETYQQLNKEYEFEALFGLATDSYDILGLLIDLDLKPIPLDFESRITDFICSKLGKWSQKYPVFSAKAVRGKKLFEWAKEGKLSEIQIPEKQIEIYSFEKLSQSMVASQDLAKYISEHIDSIEGDFRQQETKARWQHLFEKLDNVQFLTIKFRLTCSSGTYVRGIVDDLGEFLGCSALALTIKRTKIGNFVL